MLAFEARLGELSATKYAIAAMGQIGAGMKKLETSTVWRGGISADYIRRELGARPNLSTFEGVIEDVASSGIQISVNIASKGGGTTTVVVKLDTASFADIAECMMKADRKAAIKAFTRTIEKSL